MSERDPNAGIELIRDLAASIDSNGYAWVPVPHQPVAAGWFLHTGTRMALFRHPDDPSKLILHLLGGAAAEEGWEEEGVTILLTAAGLRSLAADLIAGAEEIERRRN